MSASLRITLAVSSFLFVLAPALSFAGTQTGRRPGLVRHPAFRWTLDVASQVESNRHQTVLSAQDEDVDLPTPSVARLTAQPTAARPRAISRIVSVSRMVFIRSVSTNIFLSTLIL
jgi:hypothetical protein